MKKIIIFSKILQNHINVQLYESTIKILKIEKEEEEIVGDIVLSFEGMYFPFLYNNNIRYRNVSKDKSLS
jgi:hypothetical protein